MEDKYQDILEEARQCAGIEPELKPVKNTWAIWFALFCVLAIWFLAVMGFGRITGWF